MTKIPNQFHFVFGLKEQIEEFHILYYLCLRSCIDVNKPERVFFYYHYEPHGPWWDLIKGELDLVEVELEDFVVNNLGYYAHHEGRFIQAMQLNYAHQADFIRLRVLEEHGGIYADMDTLFVKPYPTDLSNQEFVIGTEGQLIDDDGSSYPSLCNALMMAKPNSEFVSTWLEHMYEVFDGTWSKHSCQAASKLAEEFDKQQITVVPQHFFFKHDFTAQGIETLFRGFDHDTEEVYSMHLWNHLWWDEKRTDFSTFHQAMLTEDYIREVDTTYNVIARQYLP